MKRSTAAGSFFFPVISVMTEISDNTAPLSSGAHPHTRRQIRLKTSQVQGTIRHLRRLFRSRWGSGMVEKFSQQRDLFESERSFRLLVEGVADYALYMLDPGGVITSWNIGGE